MGNVIIVESPSKSTTISHYLDGKYKVLSSKGHIWDLATSGKGGLGIDIENNFNPSYKIMKGKEKLVEALKKECKGNNVYLATDPDREGEAIAYHLAKELNLDTDSLNRITFHEITETAVKEALKNPSKIDLKMVDSQETRRIIDRILGFKLSKLLQKKIGSKSAGRVQSAALLLIVELEQEIKAFVPEEYFELEANINGVKIKLEEINGKKIDFKNRIKDRSILESLKSRLLSFKVIDIEKKEQPKASAPTYTTSTMQQDASIKLGFSPTKTMQVAQKLYEGVSIGGTPTGLITYMRTDSTRLANTFVEQAKEYILSNYGKRYVGSIKTKSQKNAQDAHEGIRPTSVLRNPDSIKQFLTSDEYKLYNLIYKRTLASLMSNAIYNVQTIKFENTDSIWTTSGKKLIFDGYLKVYGTKEDDEDTIPSFELGKSYNSLDVYILDKTTEPKSRYTEASLIKDMEEKGIGRPSTYAQTLHTLKERKYVSLEKKFLVPTEQGILTTNKLKEYFSDIINVKYTANMETDLDKIAEGIEDKLEELNKFYDKFVPLFDKANENMDALYPIMTDKTCPQCGKPLVIRLGKFGEFTACSAYPKCKYIEQAPKEENENKDTGVICPICGKGHLLKKVATKGKNKGNAFYSCSNYPKCKTAFNDEPTLIPSGIPGVIMLKDKDGNIYPSNRDEEEIKEEESNVICPKCGKGHMVKRVASRGKNKGSVFYGCSNYPRCKNLITIEEYNNLKY